MEEIPAETDIETIQVYVITGYRDGIRHLTAWEKAVAPEHAAHAAKALSQLGKALRGMLGEPTNDDFTVAGETDRGTKEYTFTFDSRTSD